MQEPDAQVGADDAGVIVDEGTAEVGVKLVRNAASLDGLLERVVEAAGIGSWVIGCKGDQPGVIIQDQTQMRGEGFASSRELWAW
jgi:hypothetical protein